MKSNYRDRGILSTIQFPFVAACLALSLTVGTHAEEPFFDMQDLFGAIRMPTIVIATDGSILAFAKGCRLSRRSEDGGKTWSEAQTVGGDRPKEQDHPDAAKAIVDENTGDVLLVCPSKGYQYRSKDHGKTWSREETKLLPNLAGHGDLDGIPVYSLGAEAGITLKYGKHKGRLLMPVRFWLVPLDKGGNSDEYWPYCYNTAIYSDDGGKVWQVAEPVQTGTGEGALAELSDGRIYYNSRSHMSVDHRRQIAWSHDGGHHFADWSVSDELLESAAFASKFATKRGYGCNAGLARMPSESGKDVLLFSTPDNPGGRHRVNMTVWVSLDGAASWAKKRLIYKGRGDYSSMTVGKDGTIYLLFESFSAGHISLARFNLAWVLAGEDLKKE
jgi:sialidase-1